MGIDAAYPKNKFGTIIAIAIFMPIFDFQPEVLNGNYSPLGTILNHRLNSRLVPAFL